MTLSQRLEQAGPGEQRVLLTELWLVAKEGESCQGWLAATIERSKLDRILAINTNEAFLAAAMMMVPGGWETAIYLGGQNTNVQMETEDMRQQVNFYPIDATASTPALALAAAIAKAREV